MQKVTQILTRLHYKNLEVDDSLSTKLHSNYVDYLDYNKSYFIEEDMVEFEKYR